MLQSKYVVYNSTRAYPGKYVDPCYISTHSEQWWSCTSLFVSVAADTRKWACPPVGKTF